jgi:hypothetical protein
MFDFVNWFTREDNRIHNVSILFILCIYVTLQYKPLHIKQTIEQHTIPSKTGRNLSAPDRYAVFDTYCHRHVTPGESHECVSSFILRSFVYMGCRWSPNRVLFNDRTSPKAAISSLRKIYSRNHNLVSRNIISVALLITNMYHLS